MRKGSHTAFSVPQQRPAHGYHFEYNFGHGYHHLSTVIIHLIMLAFLIDQRQQRCCGCLIVQWLEQKANPASDRKHAIYSNAF